MAQELFPRSYAVFVGCGYLYNHDCYNRFTIVSTCLSLYFTILNHPFTDSIMVKAFSMRSSSRASLLILYGPIRSTDKVSHGMASAFLAGY